MAVAAVVAACAARHDPGWDAWLGHAWYRACERGGPSARRHCAGDRGRGRRSGPPRDDRGRRAGRAHRRWAAAGRTAAGRRAALGRGSGRRRGRGRGPAARTSTGRGRSRIPRSTASPGHRGAGSGLRGVGPRSSVQPGGGCVSRPAGVAAERARHHGSRAGGLAGGRDPARGAGRNRSRHPRRVRGGRPVPRGGHQRLERGDRGRPAGRAHETAPPPDAARWCPRSSPWPRWPATSCWWALRPRSSGRH